MVASAPKELNMQTILLTDDEAKSFLEWRKHQDTWDILVKAGIANTKGGIVELSFNFDGVLTRIEMHQTVFQRMKVKLSTSHDSTEVASSGNRPHTVST